MMGMWGFHVLWPVVPVGVAGRGPYYGKVTAHCPRSGGVEQQLARLYGTVPL